ncbi:MAG TPA: hypothetical protein DDW30_06285 [Clostridiales bacterium]|nr:hypothetical protein [Clostridiales bacterium]
MNPLKEDMTLHYTVLVVDDEQDQRQAIIERVRWADAGFAVVGEAENGVEALDLIETLEPDLILTDIRMPMISGSGACAAGTGAASRNADRHSQRLRQL